MIPACLQTQDCPHILFPLEGTLSVCMKILPTLNGSPATTFCIVAPNPLTEKYNRSMSSDRISVEWIFGVISNYFKFGDLKKKSEDGLKPNR